METEIDVQNPPRSEAGANIRQSPFMLQVLNEHKVRSDVTVAEAQNLPKPWTKLHKKQKQSATEKQAKYTPHPSPRERMAAVGRKVQNPAILTFH